MSDQERWTAAARRVIAAKATYEEAAKDLEAAKAEFANACDEAGNRLVVIDDVVLMVKREGAGVVEVGVQRAAVWSAPPS